MRDTSQHTARLLGPSPLKKGFARWILAGVLSFAAWRLYQAAPLAGLVGVGLAPFVNMYLFFRGLSLMERGILHWKTRRAAERLGLEPDWGSNSGGYLLVDESRGMWIANGISGRMDALADVTCRVQGQAFLLDLQEEKKSPPAASVGMGSAEELEAVAARLARAAVECREKQRQAPPGVSR